MKTKIILIIMIGSVSFLHPKPNSAVAAAQPPAILLFIGDGMGAAQRTAARWYQHGPNGSLAMDLPTAGWSQTAAADNPITDSAAGATALASGIKTNNGYVGVNPNGQPVATILEQAQARGLAVGLVTNAPISHATPAAFGAHVNARAAITEIAAQLLEAQPNVLLGGGEDQFLPVSEAGCHPGAGDRSDGRNLIVEAISAGYTYVCTAPELAAIDPQTTPQLLGLFAGDGMARPHTPSLAAMTTTALDILSQNPNGFFLMVEGGQIDWAAHSNDAANVITDTLNFDAAVQVGLNYSQTNPNAIILITADHETGGMRVSFESSGAADEDGPFYTPGGSPFYINWTTIGHTAVDVPVTGRGYLAARLAATFENTFIYSVMRSVLGWEIWVPLTVR